MKPGLTGWAQVRCGYAGSDIGSAWKVCHDLYYLKHRSLALNLIILGETVRTLVADAQYTAEPASVDFILAPTPTVIEPAAAPAAS
jgi:lipopolysaccharide/colanic/teichoic acid biosynthesis glycosyltransferase